MQFHIFQIENGYFLLEEGLGRAGAEKNSCRVRYEVQCNLDLVTLLVSPKTDTKLDNVTKSNDFI